MHGYNKQKFRELIVYIADKCGKDETFGRVKLNKLLFFIDQRCLAELGSPATGATYKRRDFGPTPNEGLPVFAELAQDESLLHTEEQVPPRGNIQHVYKALRSANLEFFSEAEVALFDAVIKENWGKTGYDISNESHELPCWIHAEDGEVIPYGAMLLAAEPAPLSTGQQKRFDEILTRFRAQYA